MWYVTLKPRTFLTQIVKINVSLATPNQHLGEKSNEYRWPYQQVEITHVINDFISCRPMVIKPLKTMGRTCETWNKPGTNWETNEQVYRLLGNNKCQMLIHAVNLLRYLNLKHSDLSVTCTLSVNILSHMKAIYLERVIRLRNEESKRNSSVGR